MTITSVTVLGGGTAGFIAAGMVKRSNPNIVVKVLRSANIPHIMVGEGTVGSTPSHFHDRLGISKADFFQQVDPTWKLGIRFKWGRRESFDYHFGRQFSKMFVKGCEYPLGFYVNPGEPLDNISLISALMTQNKTHLLNKAGGLDLTASNAAYHFENEKFVGFLEQHILSLGVEVITDTIVDVKQNEQGIDHLVGELHTNYRADLFVDCSGFGGQLIHKTLGEPHRSFRDQLFCNKAVVGGWRRTNEALLPYTTSYTMNAGWCWQIEHHRYINCGYVYSDAFISDEEAVEEFKKLHPMVADTRLIPFETRATERAWVKNVVAIGNANGFVEPLEATNIQVICNTADRLATLLANNANPKIEDVDLFNAKTRNQWDSVKDFLALHYKYNIRLDTDFWRSVRANTHVGRLQKAVDYYIQNGPSEGIEEHIPESDLFGSEGLLTMLIGLGVQSNHNVALTSGAYTNVAKARQAFARWAAQGVGSDESTALVKRS